MHSRESQFGFSVALGEKTGVQVPEPGLARRIGAHNTSLMLVENTVQAGFEGSWHSHPHNQIIYVVDGRVSLRVGNADHELATRDSAIIDGGVEHRLVAIETSIVLDIFSPRREDFLV
ncbi:MAG TPA: cupin domain-containing protein [Clostridia bacterium]|nr:cupin domain-containing protein [Clostridia bacterium]